MDRHRIAYADHLKSEREAELDYADNLPARKWKAEEDLRDPEALKRVLNDADLATPLAIAFVHLDRAIEGHPLDVSEVLEMVQRIRKSCFDWLMGE